ncbi:hypothetical protein J437_LFUL005816 [Ladona fulva]|uniref:C2H2-type domain-containing protein n=1 Tax=Ladona fulva TaxID=123851 RepID=A0A8K0KGN7_LADFU|nr:hypothetical protein J437_LFUL005816 [Ladona fulva]
MQQGKRKGSQVVVKSGDGFNEEDYVICHHCGEKSKTKIELKEHICRAHLSTFVGDKRGGNDSECLRKSFRCSFCQKEFNRRNGLTKHLKIHNGIKPHKCNVCSYSTANGSHLRRHIYHVHNGDKPFKCNSCEYSTTVETRLKSHIERHTKEMPYRCDKCDFKASVKARFMSHMRKHIDKKPFKCDVCDYGTAFEPVLRSHMYMHIGEKPFCCDICKYGTTKRSTLKAHMYKHTGERPFKCHICEFSSRTVSDLKRHIRVHTALHVLARHLARLERKVDEIYDKQVELLQRINPDNSRAVGAELCIPENVRTPLQTQNDIEELEKWLSLSKDNAIILEEKLSLLGGKKLVNVTNRILESLFENKLALHCNWTGRNQKYSLKDLKLMKIVKGAVRRNKQTEGATDDEITTCISNWFRFTKDRDGGREMRRNK